MKRLARVLVLSGVVAVSMWVSNAPAKAVVICDDLVAMGACIGNHRVVCEWSYGDPGVCQCVSGAWDCV